VQGLVIATVAPEGITIDYFADSSSDLSSSDDSSDPELQPQDKWACLRCKQKNQPIPRYCQHCFAVSIFFIYENSTQKNSLEIFAIYVET